MHATMLLADYAQVAAGKLTIVGAGWNVTGPAPVSCGIAIDVEVPWDQANTRHRLRLELRDADGQPVRLGDQDKAVAVEREFEVGRPPGHPPGAPLSHKLAVNLGPLPLPADGSWEWRLVVNGQVAARRPFRTRPGRSKARPTENR